MQKSATPIPTPTSIEHACEHVDITKPNAVVIETSRQNEFEMHAQTNAALIHLVGKLKSDQHARKHLHTEPIEAKAAHMMTDQVAPCCFGLPFAFMCSYNA